MDVTGRVLIRKIQFFFDGSDGSKSFAYNIFTQTESDTVIKLHESIELLQNSFLAKTQNPSTRIIHFLDHEIGIIFVLPA